MVVNEGNVNVHTLLEHPSNDPIFDPFSETGADERCSSVNRGSQPNGEFCFEVINFELPTILEPHFSTLRTDSEITC